MTTRTVIVTGGAKGLGRAFAEAIGRADANVIITGREADALQGARDDLRALGITSEAFVADVCTPGAMSEVVRQVESTFGGLDVLVNNAGVLGPVGPSWEVAADAWWRTVEVNTYGTFLPGRKKSGTVVGSRPLTCRRRCCSS